MTQDSEKTLSRTEASKYLDISTRTLDRYVKNNKLNPLRRKGRLYFRLEELEQMKLGREVQNPHLVSEEETLPAHPGEKETGKYKILWEAAKEELQTKDQLLLDLNHRLGFLESELKNSIPLLESQNSQKGLQEEAEEKNKIISSLQKKLYHARLSRIVLLVVVILLLTASFLFVLANGGIQ